VRGSIEQSAVERNGKWDFVNGLKIGGEFHEGWRAEAIGNEFGGLVGLRSAG
jgi:hypothetical protein